MGRKRVDFVAPPFAGHLFPALQLARGLHDREGVSTRVLTTASGLAAVRACGLEAVELLPGANDAVLEIARPRTRIGSHPLKLLRQFRANLDLMATLRAQLHRLWANDAPDLVLADFVVPVAGFTAESLHIPWWTGMPSPCVVETATGTPAYLGGWSPPSSVWGRWRDACGRKLIRGFKRTVHALHRRQLAAIGLERLYRPDGSEAVYSPRRILGYGLRELEFSRDWPAAFEFVGPLTQAPPLPHTPPMFEGSPTVLVSLGTHLDWAKPGVAQLFAEVARRLPEVTFHLSWGRPGETAVRRAGNVVSHDFIPYGPYLSRYAAVVHHGGTGVMYACLEAGVPALVWPHDYDQFDHAARLVAAGVALRCTGEAAGIVRDLRRLLQDPAFRTRTLALQAKTRECDPVRTVAGWIANL